MKRNTLIQLIINFVISALALAALVFVIIFAFEFYEASNAENPDLGTGLSAAISLIFMIMLDFAIVILSVIGSVWSLILRRKSDGKAKKLFISTTVINIFASLAGAILTTVMYIINQTGA